MKILIVRMYPSVLNINNYNCQEIGLAKALTNEGHKVGIVLYTDKKKNYEIDIECNDGKKIHVYYLKARNILKNCFFDKKLYEIVNRYDIVQSAEYDQIANIILRKKLKNKLIIYHGPYKSKYTKGYNLKCIISDFIIKFNKDYLNTKMMAKSTLAMQFLKKKGFRNCEIVGVGLDEERLIKNNGTDDKIEKLFCKNNYKYLLYIGKIEDRRNIIFLLNILKKLDNNVKLIIIGNGKEKYIRKVKSKIEDEKLGNRIIYFKQLSQEKLKTIYEKTDIFVFPSKYEIFGMVLLEAMYFGNVVVSSNNGGAETLINNRKNGYIIDDFNEKNWIDTINVVLKNNDSENMEIKSNASNTIKNNFLWNKLVKKIIENYIK